MALVVGVNSGFVTTAPTTDPLDGTWNYFDGNVQCMKDTSPSGAIKITEIGWWCDNATEEANFEVGVYDHDSGGDAPNNLLSGTSRTNAKGTTAGWKKATVDIDITENTIYWISLQLDDTSTETNGNKHLFVSGERMCYKTNQSTLPSPLTSPTLGNDVIFGIYALYETTAGTNMQINIADTWKDVDSMQINIGDVWKDVESVQQNIGDTWKTVF